MRCGSCCKSRAVDPRCGGSADAGVGDAVEGEDGEVGLRTLWRSWLGRCLCAGTTAVRPSGRRVSALVAI